eukprot:446594-Rhodomonas_salina.1
MSDGAQKVRRRRDSGSLRGGEKSIDADIGCGSGRFLRPEGGRETHLSLFHTFLVAKSPPTLSGPMPFQISGQSAMRIKSPALSVVRVPLDRCHNCRATQHLPQCSCFPINMHTVQCLITIVACPRQSESAQYYPEGIAPDRQHRCKAQCHA